MSVKVFVIFAVFALCNALTIPGTEESPDETNPIPLGETTIQQAPSEQTTAEKENKVESKPTDTQSDTVQSSADEGESSAALAPCGGGCVTSSQCAAYAGNSNCRCTWFECRRYTSDADLTDVQQFEEFIQAYSGNPKMIASAEKAFRGKQ